MSKYIRRRSAVLAALFGVIYLPFYVIFALTKRYH